MKLAGFCFIVIALIFVFEFTQAKNLLSRDQSFDGDARSIAEKVDNLKIAGLIQVALLFVAGISLIVDSNASAENKSIPVGNLNSKKEVKLSDWSTTNLNIAVFRNGDPIPEAGSAADWKAAAEAGRAAWCYYDNDPANEEKYGKLYNWYAVSDARGLCPDGWHIPSDAEWNDLANALGGKDVAGKKMKSHEGWADNGSGTNESEFSGLPGGYRDGSGTFHNLGRNGHWWNSTEYNTSYAWSQGLGCDYDRVNRDGYSKGSGMSVRCLKD